MGIWQRIKDQPWFGAGLAIAIIALAVWRPWGRTAQAHAGRWYYDLTEGQLVVADFRELPPVTLASGHEAVIAHVFTCGNCADDSHRFIGYLERYSEAGKQQLSAPRTGDDSPPNPTAVVEIAAAPAPGKAPQWLPMMSPAAMTIRNVSARCPDGKVSSCFPE